MFTVRAAMRAILPVLWRHPNAALAEAEKAVEGAKGFMAAKGNQCVTEHARSGLGGAPLQAKLSCDIKR